MTAKTLDQTREQKAFDRGFGAAKQAAIAICDDEERIALAHQNQFRDGMAHGAERCGNRISRLGAPQGHED